MKNSRAALRYATALFSTAKQLNSLEDVRKEVGAVISLIDSSKELELLLGSPIVRNSDKQAIMQKIVSAPGVSEILKNMLKLMIEKGRSNIIKQMCASFVSLYNDASNIQPVTVISAKEIGAEQRSAIESKVAAFTGKSIESSYRVDPTLIGGLIVQMGQQVLDGSVVNQLRELKKELHV